MLIIKACGVQDEERECRIIQEQAEMYGINTKTITPSTADQLREALNSGETYDYIYLSCHGNEEGICNGSGTMDLEWHEFGTLLCETACMNESAILMLSCCRGGLNQVAYDLFWSCEQISYVVGPRRSLASRDMHACYSLLLYLMVEKDLDPVVACEKIKLSTDIRFFFSDRLEAVTEPSFIRREDELREKYLPIWKAQEQADYEAEMATKGIPVAADQGGIEVQN